MFKILKAHAHCDVPCGIYDPYQAQIDAHTVVRMVDLISSLTKEDPERKVKFSRYVAVKEAHAENAKHEVRVIWGDFMKPETTPSEVNELVWKIMKLGGAAKQQSTKESAVAFRDAVLQFSEAFWKMKGKSPRRVAAPFPSGGEIVLPE